jgi:hypothetical protein
MEQAMTSFFRSYGDPATLQSPADVAVVTATILRPSLVRAVQSVFAQRFPGRIQMLIGLDALFGSPELLDQACANRPPNVVVQALYPGYSTSVRHGGAALPVELNGEQPSHRVSGRRQLVPPRPSAHPW